MDNITNLLNITKLNLYLYLYFNSIIIDDEIKHLYKLNN